MTLFMSESLFQMQAKKLSR